MSVSLTLLTGFLGAGKTTVLNHLVRHGSERRLGVLVNDFGDIDIDADLVARADGETITLANGCICCTIRDDLVLTMFRLLHRDDPPEHIVVECSGVSDPAEVLRGFDDARMHDIVRIESVVAVVDAERFHEVSFVDEPLALHQVVVSDLAILNKTDLIEPEQVDEAEQRLQSVVPDVRMLRAERGVVPVDLVLGTGRFDLDRLLQRAAEPKGSLPRHDELYRPWSFSSVGTFDPGALRAALDELPVGIIRAKAIVQVEGVADRQVIVHVVGKRVEVTAGEPWGPGPRRSAIVAIGKAGSFDPQALTRRFEACVTSRGGGATSVLGRWVRRLWPTRG